MSARLDRLETGQVEELQLDAIAVRLVAQFVDGLVASALVATSDYDAGAALRQLESGLVADATVAAGNENCFAFQLQR